MKTISKLFSQLLSFFFGKKSEPVCMTTVNVSVEDKVAVVNAQPIAPVKPAVIAVVKEPVKEVPLKPKKSLPKKPTKVARAPAKKAVPMKQAAKKVPTKVAK